MGANLADALLACADGGMGVQKVVSDGKACGSGVFVCDAATDAELASLPRRVTGIERPILWCGTAGLAHALTEDQTATQTLPVGSALVVIGSSHRVSQRQVEVLAARSPEAIRFLDESLDQRALRQFLERRLRGGKVAAIAANFGVTDSASIRRKLASAFCDVLPHLQPPDLVVAAGGETLLLVLDAVDALSALVEGEVMPGVARGRVVGGAWNQVVFASKSGAFGTASTLVDLLASRQCGERT